MSLIKHCSTKFHRMSARVEFLPALITRVVVGIVFVESGWGKLNNLPKVIEFFSSLGIPAPHLQAPFVAGLELVAGLLVLFGLATRFASVPLVGIMLVAIRTAKWEEIESLSSLFSLSEALYIVLLVWLIVKGAGRASVDSLLDKKYGCGAACSTPEKAGR